MALENEESEKRKSVRFRRDDGPIVAVLRRRSANEIARIRGTETRASAPDTNETEKKDIDETEIIDACYKRLNKCVFETIKNVMPERKWIKKNGRVVSQGTKELFTKRAQEFQQGKLSLHRSPF